MMYYDATNDVVTQDDIRRIEMSLHDKPEWEEIRNHKLGVKRHSTVGTSRRFCRGNGGYGPYRPDGREQNYGPGNFYERGSKLCKPEKKRHGPTATFKRDGCKKLHHPEREIGPTVFVSKRDDTLIMKYHLDRLIKSDLGIGVEQLLLEAKMMTFSRVGKWNIKDILSRRVTQPFS